VHESVAFHKSFDPGEPFAGILVTVVVLTEIVGVTKRFLTRSGYRPVE
jgi:hypothetical protein